MEYNFSKKTAGKSFLWILYVLEILGITIGIISVGLILFGPVANFVSYTNAAQISLLCTLVLCIIELTCVSFLRKNTLFVSKKELRYNTRMNRKKEFNTYYVKDINKATAKQNMFFYIITSNEQTTIEKRYKKINKEGNEEIIKRESVQILKIPKMFDVDLSSKR